MFAAESFRVHVCMLSHYTCSCWLQSGGGVVLGLVIIGVIWGIFFKPKPQTGLTNRAALEATLNQEKLAKEIAKNLPKIEFKIIFIFE